MDLLPIGRKVELVITHDDFYPPAKGYVVGHGFLRNNPVYLVELDYDSQGYIHDNRGLYISTIVVNHDALKAID